MLQNDQSISEQIQKEFLAECDEVICTIENLLIEIEQDPQNSQLHTELFRYVHTLKGSGAAAGFASLSEFTHHLEVVLDRVRTLEITPDAEVIGLLLKSIDCISHHISELNAVTNLIFHIKP